MIVEIEKLNIYFWKFYLIVYQSVTLINIIRYALVYVKLSSYGQLAY